MHRSVVAFQKKIQPRCPVTKELLDRSFGNVSSSRWQESDQCSNSRHNSFLLESKSSTQPYSQSAPLFTMRSLPDLSTRHLLQYIRIKPAIDLVLVCRNAICLERGDESTETR